MQCSYRLAVDTHPLAIGSQAGDTLSYPWSGVLDEVRIYTRSLAQADTLHLSGCTALCISLVSSVVFSLQRRTDYDRWVSFDIYLSLSLSSSHSFLQRHLWQLRRRSVVLT